MTERKLLLIDAYSLVYRAFFALPPLSMSSGQPVSAAYGFDRMLNRVLKMEKPTHVVACFDAGIPAARLEAVPQYKAQRPEMPDDLRSQFPIVRRILETLAIPIVEIEGEEADDCIATLAVRAGADAMQSVIVSGDLDLLQLVGDHCTVVVTRRGITDMTRFDVAAVKERFGLAPEQLPDYRGLKGDPSDNLPGVPGIGEKTAAKLIAQFGSLENVLAHADEITPKRIAELLRTHAAQARAYRDVSRAKRDLAIELSWDASVYRPPPADRLNDLYRSLEFRSLMRGGDVALSNVAAERSSASVEASSTATLEIAGAYQKIDAPDGAANALQRARDAGLFALAAVPELASWRAPKPAGFALAWRAQSGCVIPSELLLDHPPVSDVFAKVMADASARKVVFGAKDLTGWLGAHDIAIAGIAFDVMLAAALLDPARGETTLAQAAAYHGHSLPEDFEAKTRSPKLFARPDLEARHAAYADAVLRLHEKLRRELEQAGMQALFEDVELPLASVLAELERTGFRLDLPALDDIRANLDRIITDASRRIFELAGSEFNINSPKALGSVLFEQLKLPGSKKTQTGYATGIEVLAPLAAEHEIAAKILEYREVAKLKSTYVDALPALVDPSSGRLHTTLNQIGAATGRLSSNNPNLQNIPVRGEAGRAVRRAFLPPTPGNVLLAADYSQIELRLFAHLSQDPSFMAAFAAGEDIHDYSARAVFGVPAGEPLSAELRRRTKAVNFGILYGMGPHGLAQQVGFSRTEAKQFITTYFTRFPRVKPYIDGVLEEARTRGYVTTILGRRRYLPDLASDNRMLRAAAERMAVNAPLQGSAADLIKLAMVRIARRIEERKLPAHLLLQVHDELIFDVPPDLVPEAREEVKAIMEHAMDLRVPLVVDVKVGPNWGAAE